MKKYVGIDVSLSKAGLSIITADGKVDVLACPFYKRNSSGENEVGVHFIDSKGVPDIYDRHVVPSGMPKIERVMYIVGILFHQIDAVKKDVDFVAVELPAWGQTRFVSYDIGMAFGMVLQKLTERKIDYVLVHPTKLRSFVSPTRYKGKDLTKKFCESQGVVFPVKQIAREYVFDMSDAYVLSLISKLFAESRESYSAQIKMDHHKWRIFRGKDSKGKEVGLLDRPDLYRIFKGE